MAKLRLRNIINKIPLLDGWRLTALAWCCNHGSEFFGHSYNVTKIVAPSARPFLNGDKPAIFSVYHGRIVGLLHILKDRRKLSILISQSRDGEIIARALHEMGFSITRGSPGRGAVQGAMQTIKAAKSNQYPVVVVDGPRGPIYEIKTGIIKMAELTGLPIIPFTCASRSHWHFWGWDKFMGPLWGTPHAFIYGEPIFVPAGIADEDIEVLRVKLSETMQHLDRQAHRYWQSCQGWDSVWWPAEGKLAGLFRSWRH
jgi:lysophospholipid acyltransferase (LPLAT)-like uncharacterized protein